MIIINNKAYYTEREKLDGRLFLGKIQENYISLWDKWYKNIPESQTYDYTEIDTWYKTHPDIYTGKWEEWYNTRPAIPTDLATDNLEGWSAWEKNHPKFPDASVISKYGKVKKIYVDYPALVQIKYIEASNPIDDRLLKGLWYDSHISDSRDFSGTSDRALPTDNVKIHYLDGDSDGPKSHRALVYPDENYFDIHQNTVMSWLDWLNVNAETIIKGSLSNDIIRDSGQAWYDTIVDVYVTGLRSLISDLKINENIDQYRYGILAMDSPGEKLNNVTPFPIIALYSGDYIKRSKYLEAEHLSDNWIDYTFYRSDPTLPDDSYYPNYWITNPSPMKLTFGFLDSITEKDFINKRLSIIAVAPMQWPNNGNDQNPDAAFLKYEAENKSFGIKKISNSVHIRSTYPYIQWNNYTILNLPLYTVALKDDNEHLYNQYSFGENIKYKKRFISSPVLTFHMFRGYCSHAIRYNEGVLPGSPSIKNQR